MNRKNIAYTTMACLFFGGTVLGVLLLAEWHLKNQGDSPGWRYNTFRTVEHAQIDTLGQVMRITSDSINVIANVWGNYPLNLQGFVSTLSYDSQTLKRNNKKKVMIIGDSFTHGSLPDYNDTYVALLQQLLPQYEILNFGVGGTDPLNYRLIAQKYIPIVQPDLVVVAFCGGNDEMYGDNRTPQNQFPMMWNTNFSRGGIETRMPKSLAPQGNKYFPTVDSLYQYLFRNYCIAGLTENPFANFVGQFRIGTKLWFNLHPFQKTMFDYSYAGDTLFCHRHLLKIQTICAGNKTPFVIAYIPPKGRVKYRIDFPYMQKDSYYPDLLETDYSPPNQVDIHWNENGHRKFATFLSPIIKHYLER